MLIYVWCAVILFFESHRLYSAVLSHISVCIDIFCPGRDSYNGSNRKYDQIVMILDFINETYKRYK